MLQRCRFFRNAAAESLCENDFAALLRQCGDLRQGDDLRSRIAASVHASSTFLGEMLIQMYTRCKSAERAKQVFDAMPNKRAFSWNVMISAFARNGHFKEAIAVFQSMECEPDGCTMSSVLRACSALADLERGRQAHRRILLSGLQSHLVVATALVDMYSKCGELVLARTIFEGIHGKTVVTWNAMISGCAQSGHSTEAIRLFERMDVEPDGITYASVLSACSAVGALDTGTAIHERVRASPRAAGDVFVETALVNMYAKCGQIQAAREMFSAMLQKNTVSWNTMIAAYAQRGQIVDAMQLLEEMNVKADCVTYLNALTACSVSASLEHGKRVHDMYLGSGLHCPSVESALVNMYAKCGNLELARNTFDLIRRKSVVAWNAMVTGYSQRGYPHRALKLYRTMDIEPDSITYLSILSACSSLGDLKTGVEVHERIRTGTSSLLVDTLQAALLSMYARCGKLELARSLLDHAGPEQKTACWNAMLAGYAQQGHGIEAMKLYGEMQRRHVRGNSITYALVIGACSCIGDLERGKQLFELAADSAELDMNVKTAAINMYARFQKLETARELFESMERRDVVAWNAMVSGYVQNGFMQDAFNLFRRMNLEGVRSDGGTFASLLAACSSSEDLQIGKAIHGCIREMQNDVCVHNALITMYANCEELDTAEELFETMVQRDVVSWNALLTAFTQAGHNTRALKLYDRMVLESVQPDEVTLAVVLGACCTTRKLEKGMAIHETTSDLAEKSAIVKTALVSMYANCGRIDLARELFDGCQGKTVVSWNALISGYVQLGHCRDALLLYKRMCLEGLVPDTVTYITLFSACATLGDLKQGITLHAQVGCISDMVEAALVSMYAKCGKLEVARALFDRNHANLWSWTCMISSYAHHGQSQVALELYAKMQCEGVQPDRITFVSILIACSHSGLFKEAWYCFMSMRSDHGLAPWMEHYACMIDLLGRCGHLDGAEEMLKTMPYEPDFVAWTSLLGACNLQGDVKRGGSASNRILELRPDVSGPYTLMFNLVAHRS